MASTSDFHICEHTHAHKYAHTWHVSTYTHIHKRISDACCQEIVYLKVLEWFPTNLLQHSSSSKETSIWWFIRCQRSRAPRNIFLTDEKESPRKVSTAFPQMNWSAIKHRLAESLMVVHQRQSQLKSGTPPRSLLLPSWLRLLMNVLSSTIC